MKKGFGHIVAIAIVGGWILIALVLSCVADKQAEKESKQGGSGISQEK